MKAATRDWIEKAEADHLAAVDLGRRRKLPLHDMVCFHCQQSAEKYLKAPAGGSWNSLSEDA